MLFPRSRAYVLIGLQHWRAAEPSAALARLTTAHAQALADAYKACAQPEWRWFEDELTYCNARLPQALLVMPGYADIGLESLGWLCEIMEVDGCVRLIGCDGWYPRGGRRAVYDQQGVDAAALVSACVDAYKISNDERFRRWAQLSFGWFHGQNIVKRSMIDTDSGGGYDGLTPDGVNTNQGAESLLSWLLAWEDMAETGWA